MPHSRYSRGGLLVPPDGVPVRTGGTATAGQYARAAGRALGDVESIAENVAAGSPRDVSYLAASKMGESCRIPVQPGSQALSVTVTAVFARR